jgi:hypothetical protein
MPLNYIIEGNINFNEELYKLLDEDSDDETTLCQITGLPLQDKSITLECKNQFNYYALYKEIYKQKFEFRTYELSTLNQKDQHKITNSGFDFFIKCPYCRNVQLTTLPYYEELEFKKIYGINTLDETFKIQPTTPSIIQYNYQPGPKFGDKNFVMYVKINGTVKTFKWGQCCQKLSVISNELCTSKYVYNIPGTDLHYCRHHCRNGINNYQNEQKTQKIEAKMEIYKQKQAKLKEKQKLL